jgi:hypothetical protein
MPKFISVEDFKATFEVANMKVVANAKTNKLSLLVDGTDFVRCQQTIDNTLPMAFICEDDANSYDMGSWCLINTKEGASPLSTKFEI